MIPRINAVVNKLTPAKFKVEKVSMISYMLCPLVNTYSSITLTIKTD